MGPRFALYYNVSDDLYAMNDPSGGTLFKALNDRSDSGRETARRFLPQPFFLSSISRRIRSISNCLASGVPHFGSSGG